MSRALFGTDGVRGLAGNYPLNEDGMVKIGRAVGTLFAQPGQTIALGYDPRESSEGLAEHFTSGLNQVGVNVALIGVLPTPGLAYLTREHDEFAAGAMITASHNTFEYNGIKVFDANGDKLSDETETQINRLIDDGVPDRGNGTSEKSNNLIQDYEDFLVASADGLRLDNLRIAVDTANGAASSIGQRVFERLGAQVKPMFLSPDGKNINQECGATDVKNLAEAVKSDSLDLGVAVDGDADRLIMVDNNGREVKGDYILYILAVSSGLEGVVATVMSNLGFESSLNTRGIQLERTKVGDRYVLEGLAKTGYKLGGEQSGHIILPELLKTGDALLAAVLTVKAVVESRKSLAVWCDEVVLLPQKIINLPLSDTKALEQDEVKTFIDAKTSELGVNGRLLIRASGTEPIVRVMVEAQNGEQLAKQISDELAELLLFSEDVN